MDTQSLIPWTKEKILSATTDDQNRQYICRKNLLWACRTTNFLWQRHAWDTVSTKVSVAFLLATPRCAWGASAEANFRWAFPRILRTGILQVGCFLVIEKLVLKKSFYVDWCKQHSIGCAYRSKSCVFSGKETIKKLNYEAARFVYNPGQRWGMIMLRIVPHITGSSWSTLPYRGWRSLVRTTRRSARKGDTRSHSPSHLTRTPTVHTVSNHDKRIYFELNVPFGHFGAACQRAFEYVWPVPLSCRTLVSSVATRQICSPSLHTTVHPPPFHAISLFVSTWYLSNIRVSWHSHEALRL